MQVPFIDIDNDGVNDFVVIMTFALAAILSSFAGLASLLRDINKKTNFKNVCSNMLNSGLLGLAICFFWYYKYKDNIFVLIGLCVFAGFGGTVLVEDLIKIMKEKLSAMFKSGK